MIELIFQILGTALSIWDGIEKHKYVDKLMSLKQEYYDEFNKPASSRSDAALDNIEFELRNLIAGFSAAALQPNPPAKP